MGGNGAATSVGGLKFKLSVMMFLQFFIWGAWLPLIFGYLPSLGFSDLQAALILGAFNVSAVIAMFFSNQFADRNFAAEKFLAFSHLVGGLAILALSFIRGGWMVSLGEFQVNVSFWTFFFLMLLHCLFYVPTISITNSIAFANMKDSKEFGFVRLWGTIGWIAAAWPFVFILVDWAKVPALGTEITVNTPGGPQTEKVDFVMWLQTALGTGKQGEAFRHATTYTYMAAGIASLLLAAFSLILPHTPPKPASQARESLAWLEAMKLLAYPFVLVLFVVTFLDAAVHQSYFYWCATYLEKGVKIQSNWIMPVMSIGQVAEIATMAFLGLVLKKLGWRFTMLIGILGHAARFLVFAFAPRYLGGYDNVTFLHLTPLHWAAIGINTLHGICYAFFFATVYIFIDDYFPKDARSSAQGLFNMLILGIGPFVSNFVSGRLGQLFALGDNNVDFEKLFIVPAAVALFAALLLLLFFHPPKKAEAPAG
jgi:MFS family permease